MGGRNGRKNGNHQNNGTHQNNLYAESCKDHVDRIGEDLSSFQQLSLACFEAVTDGDKQLAIQNMRAAVGVSLEVRHKREQFRQANAELKELEKEARQGEWAKIRIEKVEASRKALQEWFDVSPVEGVPELAYESAAVEPPAAYDDPTLDEGQRDYADEAARVATSESRVRPSTNRQILGNLSNPRR